MLPAVTQQNSENLAWLVAPEQKMKGYWLAVEPSPSAWKSVEKIQQFAAAEMKKEGITNFAVYPHKISHVSIFLGFTEELTTQEKRAVMQRIAQKVALLPKFDIQFKLKTATLDRGPGKYMVLKFDSPETERLNQVVRDAIKETIAAGQLNRQHLYVNGGGKDKLEAKADPHFTIGVVDVDDSVNVAWGDKHTDIKKFVNNEKTNAFTALFNAKVKNGEFGDTISFPVDSLILLGMNSQTEKVSQKNYPVLANVGLKHTTAPKTAAVTPAPSIKPAAVTPLFQDDVAVRPLYYFGMSIKELTGIHIFGWKRVFDNDKKLIAAGFETEAEARRVLDLLNQLTGQTAHTVFSGLGYKNKMTYWVRFGEERCKAFLGNDLGPKVYKNGIRFLEEKGLV